jgi:rare lipoprotein A
MRLPVSRKLPIAVLPILLALGLPASARERISAPSGNGPQADYPIVLGAPFDVDGVTYTPADTLNYDVVGFAAGTASGSGISGSHRTLPLPSYVEVTALQSGRTILVRLDRRGPMTGSLLIELSPAAAAQLGIAGGPRAPVRVRRVNPPEPERAALRAGQSAPLRMDTPASLLGVLKRRLEQQGAGTQISRTGPMPAPDKLPPVPDVKPNPATVAPQADPIGQPEATSKPLPKPAPERAPKPAIVPHAASSVANATAVAPKGGWTIQLGAFSSRARAEALAFQVGGRVEPAGSLWRVRQGMQSTRSEADAALAKARAAGYKDATIQRVQ